MDSLGTLQPAIDGADIEPLYLHLSITDPEVVQALSEAGEGRDRQEFALTALRIGILSLKAARGTVDARATRSCRANEKGPDTRLSAAGQALGC